MNFVGMKIEELLEFPLEKLEALTDAELDQFFGECLKVCPAVSNLEPVGDAQLSQTISLGSRGKPRTRPAGFTMQPQSELAKKLSKQDQLAEINALMAELKKELGK